MERLTVYAEEVELEFDNGVESGYINLEANDFGVVVLEVSSGHKNSEMVQDICVTLSKDKTIEFLEECLTLLKGE